MAMPTEMRVLKALQHLALGASTLTDGCEPWVIPPVSPCNLTMVCLVALRPDARQLCLGYVVEAHVQRLR